MYSYYTSYTYVISCNCFQLCISIISAVQFTMKSDLAELSESVESFCKSFASNHSHQQCSCPNTTTWIPIPLTQIGTSLFRNSSVPSTLSYTIPTSVPAEAREVLVFVDINSGGGAPTIHANIKLYTEISGVKYIKYVVLRTWHAQNAISYNSDNLWFPMPTSRQLHVEYPHTCTGHCGGVFYVIGYR